MPLSLAFQVRTNIFVEIDGALKGQNPLAQGIALGSHDGQRVKPYKGGITSDKQQLIEQMKKEIEKLDTEDTEELSPEN